MTDRFIVDSVQRYDIGNVRVRATTMDNRTMEVTLPQSWTPYIGQALVLEKEDHDQ